MSGNFSLKAVLDLPSLGGGTVSPTGEYVAYYTDRSGQDELYVRSAETHGETQLTDGDLPQAHRPPIMWSRSGERIYFHKETDQLAHFDVCEVDLDGTVENVFAHDGRCIVTDESPDGGELLVLVDHVESPLLVRHDRNSGEVTRLTDGDFHVWPAGFSPDGGEIAYQANDVATFEDVHVTLANADGTDPRRLDIGNADANTYFRGWHPDQRKLLIGDETTGVRRSGVYDIDSETVSWFGSAEHVEYPRSFLRDGTGILVLRFTEQGTTVVPVIYTLDGRTRELSLTNGRMHDNPWATDDLWFANGDVLVKYETSTTRTNFYRYNTETDEHEVVVEPASGGVDRTQFVEPEFVTYESADGEQIGALLYEAEDQPSPAIVWVHGGPQQHEQRDFDARTQFLVNRGYTVFKPNYRGSTGRGRAFREAINGAWGDIDVADVHVGGQWLKRRSGVDEKRVAIFGHSYGGYHAYVQLAKHPTFWTAGIVWNGYHRWDDDSESYPVLDHSESIERPILMLHGEDDHPSIEHGRELRDRLKTNGFEEGDDFEYHELENEGHFSMATDRRLKRLRLVEEFLARRMRDC